MTNKVNSEEEVEYKVPSKMTYLEFIGERKWEDSIDVDLADYFASICGYTYGNQKEYFIYIDVNGGTFNVIFENTEEAFAKLDDAEVYLWNTVVSDSYKKNPAKIAGFSEAFPVETPIIEHWLEEDILDAAARILETKVRNGEVMDSPEAMRQFLKVKYRKLEHEVFSCIWLDQRHRVLEVEDMFRGTIDGASVYPREVVKSALKVNAAAVIFVHNHPSGNTEPSSADQRITERLKEALSFLDMRVLDHFIVGDEVVSFAERGLL